MRLKKASWIALLSTANFEYAINHFADFEQVIIEIVILLTLNKKHFLGENIIMVNPTATENMTAIKEAR